MSKTITAEVSTENKNGFSNVVTDDGKELIVAQVEVTVPTDLEEAAEFYQGEDKLIESIQSDVKRRKINAARPILREAETELDWDAVAQEAAEGYEPGRRGGFQPVSADALEDLSAAEMIEYLKSRGLAR